MAAAADNPNEGGGEVHGHRATGPRPAALNAGRTVLGWETGEPIRGRKFSKVVLVGPYWSGTNAVREEILRRFEAPVLNPDRLEVCAATPEAVAALRSAVGQAPLLSEPVQVGPKQIPRGYRLHPGAHTQSLLGRASRRRRAAGAPGGAAPWPPARPAAVPGRPPQQGGPPPAGPPPPAAAPPPAGPASEASELYELLGSLEPPVTLAFGPDTQGGCPWWKHVVRQEEEGAIDTDDDTLVVLVVKDPLFWLKSMSKHFYDIKVHGDKTSGMDALLQRLEHGGNDYDGCMELWSASCRSYLDTARFPADRCVLLRYEDFLFRFWEVMVHLSALLPARGQRLKEPPNSTRSKTHGREVRDRAEALSFYAMDHNRRSELGPEHLERARMVDPWLFEALGYEPLRPPAGGEAAVPRSPGPFCSWVPELLPGDVVVMGVSGASEAPLESAEIEDENCRPSEPSSGARVWGRVSSVVEGGAAAVVDRLDQVPREWLLDNPDDWAEAERLSRLGGYAPAPRWDAAAAHDRHVRRERLDLRLPCSGGMTGASLPLTEEGYRRAVHLRSTPQMADFIQRVVADLEVNGVRSGRVVDRRKLLGFARWFSGEANVQSLGQIRRELPGKESERWVTFAPPRPGRDAPQ